MAITYVGGVASDTGNGNNTDAWSEPIPGTYQTDDLILVFTGGTTAVAVVDMTSNPEYTDSGVEISDTTGVDRQANFFYRFATSGSDTAPTISKSVSSRIAGCMLVFRGVDTSTPFDVTVTTATPDQANRDANPAITPTTDNGALVLFQYTAQSGAANQMITPGEPSTPSGLTLRETNAPAYNYTGIASASKEDYGSGSIEIVPSDWTHTYELKIQDAQTETNYDGAPVTEGTFAPGTGHNVSDVITITGGATVTVDAVSSGPPGPVSQFTVTQGSDTGLHEIDDVLSQTGTTGSGASFSLTVGGANLTTSFGNEAALMTVALRPATSVTITDVNTTESWTDGDTGLVITGTGFV